MTKLNKLYFSSKPPSTSGLLRGFHLFSVMLLLAGCGGSSGGSPGDDPITAIDSPTVQASQPMLADMVLADTPDPLMSDEIVLENASTTEGTNVEENLSVLDNSAQVTNTNSPTVSTLNTSNANAVVMQAFDVFAGRAYDRRLTAYPYVVQAPPLMPNVNALGRQFYYDTLACDNNGEKTENNFTTGAGFGDFNFYDTTYVNCSVGLEILTGRAILSADTCCNNGYKKEFSNNFAVEFGDSGRMSLSGTYENNHFISVDNFNYEFNYSGGSLSVLGATTARTSSSMSGSFSMSPPVLQNQSVFVSIDQPFENDDNLSNLRYTRGSMRIAADDSEIVVNADNGDAETVMVTVTAAGESITSIEPWSNWFHALSFIAPTLGQDLIVTAADGDGTELNQNTYRGVISEVFKVATGERFGATILGLPGFPFPRYPSELFNGNTGFAAEQIQVCDNGGNASLRPFGWGTRQGTTGWRSVFTDCIRENRTYNGNISTRDFGNHTHFSSGLTVSDDSGSKTFEGTVHYKHREDFGDGLRPFFDYVLDNVYLDSTANNDLFVLSDANLLYSARNQFPVTHSNTTLAGRFSLSSNATNHSTINVLIAEEFSFDHIGSIHEPTTVSSDKGVLYINAGNGNELFLNATTGNSETFTVLIYQPGQSPVTITENWQDWQSLLHYNFELTQ